MEYRCQKQLLGPKLVGSWIGEHPKNFGTPYLSLQPLKIVTSNLVHNFGSWSSVSEALQLARKCLQFIDSVKYLGIGLCVAVCRYFRCTFEEV